MLYIALAALVLLCLAVGWWAADALYDRWDGARPLRADVPEPPREDLPAD